MRVSGGAVLAAAWLAIAPASRAGIELVTLPARDRVELTIYREVDLTLVRERRTLTFGKGRNRLEFSWAGTMIDPTSLELAPVEDRGRFEVLDRSYPPRVAKTLVWTVETDREGPRPVEISYFTAGVSWSATYQVVASPDGARMDLDGDVRIVNRSGEDYEDASVRLVVGHVGLVESIAELAARNDARGLLVPATTRSAASGRKRDFAAKDKKQSRRRAMLAMDGDFDDDEREAAKEIVKEGLADQFLFSIPGTETIRQGWSLRLPSVRKPGVPASLLFRYDPERYGDAVHSFFKLSNTEAGGLGTEPLPEGVVQVFRRTPAGRLAFLGTSTTKYIPVGEKVELDLGVDPELVFEVRPVARREESFEFDRRGDPSGWDEILEESLVVRSGKPFPIELEIFRHLPTSHGTLVGDRTWETLDVDSRKLALTLSPGGREALRTTATWGHGTRAERKR